jgi:hypothetical protein
MKGGESKSRTEILRFSHTINSSETASEGPQMEDYAGSCGGGTGGANEVVDGELHRRYGGQEKRKGLYDSSRFNAVDTSSHENTSR